MSLKARKYFILIAALLFVISFSVTLAAEDECIGDEGEECPLGLAEKINDFYNWALSIGGIIALGIIVFGGILYITSTGSPGRLSEAKAWITAALVGLLILFGSFLILKTLNPKLTNLEDIVLQINPTVEPPPVEVPPGPGDPGPVCDNDTECKYLCQKLGCYPDDGRTCDVSQYEPHPGMARYEDTVPLSSLNIPGIAQNSPARVLPSLEGPLRAVGSNALAKKFQVSICCGWRSLQAQFEGYCEDIQDNGHNDRHALPGNSNHGRGNAVDAGLVSGGNTPPPHGTTAYCSTLADVFYRADWKRIASEYWHFEYPRADAPYYSDCSSGF